MTDKEPAAPPTSAPTDEPAPRADTLTDEQLLKQYVERRDEDAFALLVQRFGPLVFSVCQRTLGHQQDAEDAFQATFLVLARKARTIVKAQAIAAFLCRIAYRIARKQKRQKARRHMASIDERNTPACEESPELIWQDLRPVLDEEVDRLPKKYRLPFVLCYLHGLSYEQAARQLSCPVGTLSSWLTRAREQLRRRLVQRGIALSSGLLASVLAGYAVSAPPPLDLAAAVVRHATLFAAGNALIGAGTPVELATGYLRSWSRASTARKAAWVLALGIGLLLFILVLRPRKDLDRIQGTWGISDVTIAGNPVPPQGTQMIFEGNSCKLVLADGTVVPMRFALNPATTPKRIDLSIFLPQPMPARGIYELSGDELRICYSMQGAPRPVEFASHENTTELLYRLRRSPP
jgi:RNA polymerase sigma factor (sigma-70 family)